MSANTTASLAFGAVGAFFLGPAGFTLGATLGGALFPPQLPDSRAKKLAPLNITNASYGAPIPIVYGTVRTATTLMWWSGRKTTKHKEESGGKGGPSQTTTYYTYSLDGAFAICEGPITGLRRIWINGRLMYDTNSAENQLNIQGSNKLADAVNIYYGDEDQEPSSLQESYKGSGNVPAYRGIAYIEFEDLQLEQFGNGLVNVEVEITRAGALDDGPNVIHTSTENWGGKTVLNIGGVVGVLDEGTFLSTSNVYVYPNDDDADYTITRCDLRWNIIEQTTYPVRMPNVTSGVIYGLCQNDPYFFWIARNQEGGGGTDGNLYWFRYKAGALGSYLISRVTYPVDAGYGPYGTDDHSLFGSGTDRYKTIRLGDDSYITVTEKSSGKNVLLRYAVDPLYLSPTVINTGGIDFLESLDWNPNESTLCTAHIHRDMADPDNQFFLIVTYSAAYDHDRYLCLMDKDFNILNSWTNASTGDRAGGIPSGQGLWSSDGYVMYKPNSTSNTIRLITFDATVQNSEWVIAGNTSVDNSSSYPGIIPITNNWAMARMELLTVEAVVSTSNVTVAEIVEHQSLRAGLSSAQVDTTDLSKSVDGYIVDDVTSARNVIETITPVGFFDVAEVGDKLICTERGGAISKTIPQADLAAGIESPEDNDIEIVRKGELELPKRMSISYLNSEDQYEVNTQMAERLTVQGEGISHAQIPAVLTDTNAMNIADAMLYAFYSERDTASFSISTKHIDVVPNDVISVGDRGYRIRVSDVQTSLIGPIKVTGIVESIDAVYSTVRDAVFVTSSSTVDTFVGPTIFSLIDIPMLRSNDDVFGYYVVAYGVFDSWNGASLYHSNDNTTYSEVNVFTLEADFGYVSTTMATTTFNGTWDSSLELEVRMPAGVVLQSDTDANVLAGSNAALIGTQGGVWELIQYASASATGDDTYKLSRILRGRRGTEWAMNNHDPLSRFIPVDNSGTVKFVQDDTEHLDTPVYYKGVSLGNYVQNSNPIAFTNTGRNLMPRAPCVVRGTIDSNNTKSFTWMPVSRYEYDANIAYVSSDDNNFEIDFYDSASTLLRTASATETSVAYTSADRVADGASANELIICNIFQISDTVGRGFPGIGQI